MVLSNCMILLHFVPKYLIWEMSMYLYCLTIISVGVNFQYWVKVVFMLVAEVDTFRFL